MKYMKGGAMALIGLGLSLGWVGCAAEKTQSETEVATTPTESVPVQAATVDADGFTVLFDGTAESLQANWHNFGKEGISEAWQVEAGTFTLTEKGGGDIVTNEMYDNFELQLEWKISKNGNSGIMFHVSEDYKAPYHTGPEMQILDNEGHPDAKIHMHRAGDNYDLHACSEETVKPAMEWNAVRLVVNQGKVEHWLNGTKVVEYELGSEDWKARLAKSKFTQWPDYGTKGTGVIALQDHSDPVWFRNVRIKAL